MSILRTIWSDICCVSRWAWEDANHSPRLPLAVVFVFLVITYNIPN